MVRNSIIDDAEEPHPHPPLKAISQLLIKKSPEYSGHRRGNNNCTGILNI